MISTWIGKRVQFLDLGFNPLTLEEVVQWLAARNEASPFAYVITPNVDHMVRLSNASSEVVAAYEGADLILCDSRILAKLARIMGINLPVAPGSDLVACLIQSVLKSNDRICLIGGSEMGVAKMQKLYPDLDIRHHNPPLGLLENRTARSECVRFAIETNARVTLLAVGSPQQELIAHEMARSGKTRGTALCIGAAVNFIIGTEKRAPVFMQQAGMEWAWRLMHDPSRLARRYLVDGPLIFGLAWAWRRKRDMH